MRVKDLFPLRPGRDGALAVRELDTAAIPLVVFHVAGIPPGVPVTVERSTDRSAWVPVRGAVAHPMPEGGWAGRDWAVPLGKPVFYRATVDGQVVGTAEIMVKTNGDSWLQDAFQPRNGVKVKIDDLSPLWGVDAFRQASWPLPVSTVQVMGATLPVESVGVRQRYGNIPLQIYAAIPADSGTLRRLLFQAGILLLRGAPCELLEDAFVVLPDLTETHLGNPHEVAEFTAVARIVTEPSPLVEIPSWTYSAVETQVGQLLGAATYGQVKAKTGAKTYSDVTIDPTLIGVEGRKRPYENHGTGR